ncbi:MAG: tape measure protein [Thiotrichaceae bacterium]|nr:tape measure protein [Thiotrichaceae bacterium]
MTNEVALFLRLEISQFMRDLARAKGEINSLGSSAPGDVFKEGEKSAHNLAAAIHDAATAEKELDANAPKGAQTALQNTSQAANDLNGSMTTAAGGTANLLRGFIELYAVVKLIDLFKELSASVINTSATFETLGVRLKTLTGSQEAANAAMSWIKDFTAKTPFQLDQVTKSYAGLIGAGLDAKKILPSVGDAVSAIGGGGAEIDRVVTALSQMQTKGKASAEELMQISEVGIPAMQILKDKLHLTTKQMEDLAGSGISVDKVITTLTDGLKEKFGGAMEAQSNTYAGIMSNIEDSWTQLMNEIGDAGAFNVAKGYMKEVLDYLNKIVKDGTAKEWAQNISAVMSGVFNLIALVVKSVATIAGAFTSTFSFIKDMFTNDSLYAPLKKQEEDYQSYLKASREKQADIISSVNKKIAQEESKKSDQEQSRDLQRIKDLQNLIEVKKEAAETKFARDEQGVGDDLINKIRDTKQAIADIQDKFSAVKFDPFRGGAGGFAQNIESMMSGLNSLSAGFQQSAVKAQLMDRQTAQSATESARKSSEAERQRYEQTAAAALTAYNQQVQLINSETSDAATKNAKLRAAEEELSQARNAAAMQAYQAIKGYRDAEGNDVIALNRKIAQAETAASTQFIALEKTKQASAMQSAQAAHVKKIELIKLEGGKAEEQAEKYREADTKLLQSKLQTAEKSYQTFRAGLQKQMADYDKYHAQVKQIDDSIESTKTGAMDKIRDLRRKDMSEEEAAADLKNQINEKFAASSEALAAGDTKKSQALAAEAEQLSGQLKDRQEIEAVIVQSAALKLESLNQEKTIAKENEQEALVRAEEQKAALAEQAAAIQENTAALSQLAETFGTEKMTGEVEKTKASLTGLKEQLQQAKDTLASMGQLTLDTSGAQSNLDAISQKIDAIKAKADIKVNVQGVEGHNAGGVAGMFSRALHFATGNIVPGVGSDDTVPAMLTPGEFVVNKGRSETFRDLLNFVNFGPLEKVKNAFSGALKLNTGGLAMPNIPMPRLPNIPAITPYAPRTHNVNLDSLSLSVGGQSLPPLATSTDSVSAFVNQLRDLQRGRS